LDYLTATTKMTSDLIKEIMFVLLSTLRYLHDCNVVHLDIKPANMLVSADGAVKLADFGTSKLMTRGGSLSTQRVVGTPAYMPPEMITHGKYYEGSDMWALACSAVEMATSQPPWHHLVEDVREVTVALMFHIGSAKAPNHCPLVPAHLSKDLQRIVHWCFQPNIASRPKASVLLSDPYFRSETLPLDAEAEVDFQRVVVTEANSARSTGSQSCGTTVVSGGGGTSTAGTATTTGSSWVSSVS